jgi:hypothetical protein
MWSPVRRRVVLWARLQAVPAVRFSGRLVKVPQQVR